MPGLFDGMSMGGLFGDLNQRATPFTQNNQNALLGAGLALMGGDGYSGAAKGFMAGGLADSQRAASAQQGQMAQQRLAMEQERLRMAQAEHQQRTTAAERMMGQQNQTDALIAEKYPELVGLPREVQMKALNEKFAGGSNKGSLVPVPGLDPDGNFIYLQPRADGTMDKFSTPEGIVPLSPYQKSFESSSGQAAGKAKGEAETKFKGAAPGLENSIRLVDEVISHPSLNDAVGPLQGRLPSVSAGARDFDERVEQLKGQAFLAARAELKGGGQITDYEGARAEAALLRASQSKSEEDFKKAMGEFRDALVRGYKLLAEQADKEAVLPSRATEPVSVNGYTIQQVD